MFCGYLLQSAAADRRNQQLIAENETLKQKLTTAEQEKVDALNRLDTLVLDLQMKVMAAELTGKWNRSFFLW